MEAYNTRLEARINDEDFRIQNYPRVKGERDKFQEDLLALESRFEDHRLELEVSKKENIGLSERLLGLNVLNRRLDSSNSESRLELAEIQKKFAKMTSELESSNKYLKAEREKSEDLHNKVVTLKAEFTLNGDDLQNCVKDRSILRDKFDQVTSTNTQLELRLGELSVKCRNLSADVEKCHISNKLIKSEYEAELSELRGSILSLTQQHKKIIDENDKLGREVNKHKSDNLHFKVTKERIISALRTELEETKTHLIAYQELEKEYEESLKSLTSGNHSTQPPQLFPGLFLRNNNKVMAEVVKFSNRVLRLERENFEAKTTITHLTNAACKLRNSLYSYKTAISHTGEPSKTLQLKIVDQEDQITSLLTALKACKVEKAKLKKDNTLSSVNNSRLLASLEECGPMLEEIEGVLKDLFAIKNIVIRSLRLD